MKKLFGAIPLLMLLFAGLASAHLDGGTDVDVNGYKIDFGYSPEKPVINDKTIILFNLLNTTTNESIYPDNVWVRISENDTVLFSGQFSPVAGSTTFTYTFYTPGKYTIDSTFYKNNSVLVQNTFEMNISGKTPENTTTGLPPYIYGVIGILVILLVFSLTRMHKVKKR